MNNIELDRFNIFIDKYINKDRINHAYIIETNYENKIDLAKELVKKILLFDGQITIEELIINNDLIIIDSDSTSIKTEEIEKIKEELITTSFNNNPRFYIINNAEKMNENASNKLLKFLEEPEGNIIAILLTENKKNLLETIVSRCQNFRFFINNKIFDNYEEEYVEKMFDFIMNIEQNKEEAIAFQNIIDVKKLSDRKYCLDFLNNLLFIYDDVISYRLKNNVEYFPSYVEKISKISENNSINDIKNKINAINICINRLKYNPNIKLLIDKMILLMTGVETNA